jgi:hypothetical protein
MSLEELEKIVNKKKKTRNISAESKKDMKTLGTKRKKLERELWLLNHPRTTRAFSSLKSKSVSAGRKSAPKIKKGAKVLGGFLKNVYENLEYNDKMEEMRKMRMRKVKRKVKRKPVKRRVKRKPVKRRKK